MHYTESKKNSSNNGTKSYLSDTIDNMRFPLTVLVVFLHFNILRYGYTEKFEVALGTSAYIITYLSDVLARIAVPLFFVISGFLFFYKKEMSLPVFKAKILSRIKSLFVPYILWNIIALIILLVTALYANAKSGMPHNTLNLNISNFFYSFIDYNHHSDIVLTGESVRGGGGFAPINSPLWYVRDLMVMCILSPTIYYLINNFSKTFLLLCGGLWFFSPYIFLDDAYITLFIVALFFFSVGAYLSINGLNINKLPPPLDGQYSLAIY